MKHIVCLLTAVLLLAGFNAINSKSMNDQPTVVIKTPKMHEIFNCSHGNTINITGYAIDKDGITKLEWKVVSKGRIRTYSISYPMSYVRVDFELSAKLFEGKNFVYVNATDQNGNKGGNFTIVWYVCHDLTAIAHGPYYGRVGELIRFNGSAYGGNPPYRWKWNLGDGNISRVQYPKHAYTKPGTYKVNLTIMDKDKNTSSDETEAIIYEKLIANANGPYHGTEGKTIQFVGAASGGVPPYRWRWSFGDGNNAYGQNVTHAYVNPGNYTVLLYVEDSIGNNATAKTYAVISERDTEPPFLRIVRPSNALYINDREIMPMMVPVIIGKIKIVAEATDNIGVERVEFYIDGELKNVSHISPYYWIWNEKVMGIHLIKVIAYDGSGNTATKMESVYIWNRGT